MPGAPLSVVICGDRTSQRSGEAMECSGCGTSRAGSKSTTRISRHPVLIVIIIMLIIIGMIMYLKPELMSGLH